MLFRRDIWFYQLRDALIYWIYIPLAVIGSGRAVDVLFNASHLMSNFVLHPAALCLIGVGGLLMYQAIRDLQRFGSGTPNPRRPPRRLVTEGVYHLCRHPMFLGYGLAALGVVLECRSPGTLFVSFPLFVLIEIAFLKKEEGYLARRYGVSFNDYRQRVPMLLPKVRKRRRH